jgi:hypothetical protein
MIPMLLRRAAPLMATAALLLTSACDGGPTTSGADELALYDMILEAGPADYVYSHADHWHGAPVVREGQSSTFKLHFSTVKMSGDDHEMPPVASWTTLAQHPGHNVHVVIQDTTLARWSGDNVTGTLHGLRAGASVVSFVVRRGTTTIYEAPPLNFRVQARD